MKKILLFALFLIPVPVFAEPNLTDFNILDSSVGSLGLINQDKLSNQQIDYIKETDFTTNSINSNANYILINISLNTYYLYTNSYSEDWSDTDNIYLQTTSQTTVSAPSNTTSGNIACKISNNSQGNNNTMACNYLGKNYNFTLENKSYYREHEYDYKQITIIRR